MRFKNLKTGNIVATENKTTIAMMQKSETYEELAEQKPKGKAKDNDKDAE